MSVRASSKPAGEASRLPAAAWLVLAIVLVADIMDLLDSTITTIAAPTISSSLHGGPGLIKWLGASYALALGVLLVTGGRLGDQRPLVTVLREYEDFYNTHRPHRTLKQAAPLRPLPDGVTDLDHFRVQRRDRAGGVIHEYRLVA